MEVSAQSSIEELFRCRIDCTHSQPSISVKEAHDTERTMQIVVATFNPALEFFHNGQRRARR